MHDIKETQWVKVFWVILTIDKLAVELKETWILLSENDSLHREKNTKEIINHKLRNQDGSDYKHWLQTTKLKIEIDKWKCKIEKLRPNFSNRSTVDDCASLNCWWISFLDRLYLLQFYPLDFSAVSIISIQIIPLEPGNNAHPFESETRQNTDYFSSGLVVLSFIIQLHFAEYK